MAGPPWDPELIDRIVREVVRRLLERGMSVAGDVAPQCDQELRLEQRLITLATLNGRLDGVKRVIVPKNAVITPAVRDELKDRSVLLEKQ